MATTTTSILRALSGGKSVNREAWLDAAVLALSNNSMLGNLAASDFKVSCGFPSRHGAMRKRMLRSEVIPASHAQSGKNEIFINPRIADPDDVLAELYKCVLQVRVGVLQPTGSKAHATAYREHGFRQPYRPADPSEHQAVTAQLSGKIAQVKADTINLAGCEYPHEALDTPEMPVKKQTTRLLKMQCESCGWQARTSREMINLGVPICPACPPDKAQVLSVPDTEVPQETVTE